MTSRSFLHRHSSFVIRLPVRRRRTVLVIVSSQCRHRRAIGLIPEPSSHRRLAVLVTHSSSFHCGHCVVFVRFILDSFLAVSSCRRRRRHAAVVMPRKKIVIYQAVARS